MEVTARFPVAVRSVALLENGREKLDKLLSMTFMIYIILAKLLPPPVDRYQIRIETRNRSIITGLINILSLKFGELSVLWRVNGHIFNS